MSASKSKTMIVGDHFQLEKKLGEGAFGKVYRATDLRTSQKVAVKMEAPNSKDPQLSREGQILKHLKCEVGVPAVHWDGKFDGWTALVMDLLGPSLEDLFDSRSRQFTLKTVLMLTEQIISRLEYIHSRGILHRDIKPENFLMGVGRKEGEVQIIDFGLAKQYKDPNTGKHMAERTGRDLVGTARYASVNVHRGYEPSRRDDLEAVGHLVVYWLRQGKLPWQGIDARDWNDRLRKIKDLKQNTPVDDLCKGHPMEFAAYLRYCRSLAFTDKPDYANLRKALTNLMEREQLENDQIFDWTPPAPVSPGQERRASLQCEAAAHSPLVVGA